MHCFFDLFLQVVVILKRIKYLLKTQFQKPRGYNHDVGSLCGGR